MFGPRLFVSYRRADSEASAGRLFEALKSRFGERVFLDTSEHSVRRRLSACDSNAHSSQRCSAGRHRQING